MKTQTKLYYIAYFDILGYKAFFEDKGNDVFGFLKSNVDLANDVVRKTSFNATFSGTKFEVKSFSDNFMILIEAEGIECYQATKTLSFLVGLLQLRFLEKYSILLRGSITKGDAYIDQNIVFGEGLIRAVAQEERANFPRVIIDSERIGIDTCEDLREKCVAKDEDDEYYVDFFEILGNDIGFDNSFSNNVETHLSSIKKNIVVLIKRYGKYNRTVKDPNKIRQADKTISKYAWLLSKFNLYCGLYYPDWAIPFKLTLYYRLMKCEISIE